MEKNRKKARAWLKSSTLTEYKTITTEAKLTPKQQDILDKTILKDYSQQKLAMEYHVGMNEKETGYKVASVGESINRNIDALRFEGAANTCKVTTATA